METPKLPKLSHKESLLFPSNMREAFINALGGLSGKRILDLGCGFVPYSRDFVWQNAHLVCVDINRESIDFCKAHGLEAHLVDIYHANFSNEYFDGVWANASLNLLRRYKLPNVILDIKRTLKPQGVFFVSVLEGSWLECESSRDYIACYLDEDFRAILDPSFIVLENLRFQIPNDDNIYLNYLCRKK